jgi:hypothetical protein
MMETKYFFEILPPIYQCLLQVWPVQNITTSLNGETIPLQAWTGPEGSRKLRLPDFKTIGT